jgi:hypothetical protein
LLRTYQVMKNNRKKLMMRFRTKIAILLAVAFLSLVVFYRIATSPELDLSRVQKKQMTR